MRIGVLLKTALFAGFLAAVLYSVVQAVSVVPLILEAEKFETGAGHHGAATPAAKSQTSTDQHSHDEVWSPADGLERTLYTFFANLVAGIGFGLVLAAAIALSRRQIDGPKGLLWGLAGFAVFHLAPALGLPPELPGSQAAELELRQVWWVATVAATAVGLVLVVFTPQSAFKIVGLAIIVIPHVVGAPHPDGGAGAVPPELAAKFAVWSLAASAGFWLILGWSSGILYRRLSATA